MGQIAPHDWISSFSHSRRNYEYCLYSSKECTRQWRFIVVTALFSIYQCALHETPVSRDHSPFPNHESRVQQGSPTSRSYHSERKTLKTTYIDADGRKSLRDILLGGASIAAKHKEHVCSEVTHLSRSDMAERVGARGIGETCIEALTEWPQL